MTALPCVSRTKKIFTQMSTTTTTTTPPPKHHRHTFVGEYLHRCPPPQQQQQQQHLQNTTSTTTTTPPQHLHMTSYIRGGFKTAGESAFSLYFCAMCHFIPCATFYHFFNVPFCTMCHFKRAVLCTI